MSVQKFRPVLSALELDQCVSALAQFNPGCEAFKTLSVFQYKQKLGLVTPANASYHKNTPVQKEHTDQTYIKSESERIMDELKRKHGVSETQEIKDQSIDEALADSLFSKPINIKDL